MIEFLLSDFVYSSTVIKLQWVTTYNFELLYTLQWWVTVHLWVTICYCTWVTTKLWLIIQLCRIYFINGSIIMNGNTLVRETK